MLRRRGQQAYGVIELELPCDQPAFATTSGACRQTDCPRRLPDGGRCMPQRSADRREGLAHALQLGDISVEVILEDLIHPRG